MSWDPYAALGVPKSSSAEDIRKAYRKLAKELHSLSWRQHANGRLKVTPKDELRKELGRSPDRYECVALSAWEPLSMRDEIDTPARTVAAGPREADTYRPTLDPYGGAATWGGR